VAAVAYFVLHLLVIIKQFTASRNVCLNFVLFSSFFLFSHSELLLFNAYCLLLTAYCLFVVDVDVIVAPDQFR